jgi:hypothetical protein
MKVSLVYPKIPENTNGFLDKCIAFEKYDGTNLHWTWNKSDGWHLFGTRRTEFFMNRIGASEFNKEHSALKNAPHVFNEQFRDRLTAFFSQHKVYSLNKITVFFEFLGPNSFAGGHSELDVLNDDQDLILIDVMVGKNIIPPKQLIDDFEWLNNFLAKVVYTGKYTGQFTEDVRKGKFNINEGVVCKGIVDGQLFMTKVKTNDYLKRLTKR